MSDSRATGPAMRIKNATNPARIIARRRSRGFSFSSGFAIWSAMSLASRARSARSGARGPGVLLLGRALRVLGALQVELHDVLLTILAHHLVRARDLHVREAFLAAEVLSDRLRVRDRADDAVDDDVPLLDVELLDVVDHRLRDVLRELHHDVEGVGVRERVFVVERGLHAEELLGARRARRLFAEDLLRHRGERLLEDVLLLARGVELRPRG